MDEHEIEAKLSKALACLDFLVGLLSKTREPLDDHEVAGLAYILTDILDDLREIEAWLHASGRRP